MRALTGCGFCAQKCPSPCGVDRLVTRAMADTFTKETIPHWGPLGASMSVRGPSSSQMAYCKGFHWRNTGTYDGAKRKQLVIVMGSATHTPLRSFFKGFRELLRETRTLFQYSPLVRNLGILVLERVGRLPSESHFFHSHPSG